MEFAVAVKPVEIVADVSLFDPAGDLLDRRVVIDDVARETAGILFPKFVVAVENVVRNRAERLTIDFHDDAVRGEVRIHPFQRQAFLDEKFGDWDFCRR